MRHAALLVMFSVTAVLGDTPDPGRGVARISVLSGDVSVKRGDSGEWIAAAINAPLVVQDSLHTGAGASRAEIQFDWANMIRLSHDAEVRLAELEKGRYQVQVARGTTTFRVLRDSDAEMEISTPSVSVRPLKKGEYRVTVLVDGTSEVTVRSGEAEIFTPRGSERLGAGNTMLARGTASEPEFQVVRSIPEDDWDRWNERRDRDLERSRSYQYVSRDIYGADDLDGYGSWTHVAPYGYVWSPRVAPGWAPYRYGRWSWIDWYGWTWVSHDPWGWAPYHYGRWFYHGARWSWYPGPLHVRNYWRPALVAFFGFGRGGIGVGFGNVGWVPLAPYEPYYPWYGRGYYSGFRNRGFVDNRVHVVNNINIRNVYRNSRISNGITAVDGSDFGRRSGRFLSVGSSDIQRASLVRGQVPLAPGRESLRLADREIRGGDFARSSSDRQFFSRRQPAPVDRVSFEDQRRGVEQLARRTWRPEEAGGGQRAEVQRGETRVAGGGQGRTAEDPASQGWRRIGAPSRADASPRRPDGLAAEPSSDVRGWRQFGAPSRVAGESRQDPARNSAEPRTFDRRDANADGWNRFGTPGRQSREDSGSRISGGSPGAADSVRSDRFDSGGRSSNRSERSRFAGSRDSSSDSIRISPPIVRERQSPRSAPGFSRSESGGERRSPESSGGSRFSGNSSGTRGNGGGMRSMPQSGGGGRIGGGSRGGDGGGRSGGGGGARSQGNSGGRGR